MKIQCCYPQCIGYFGGGGYLSGRYNSVEILGSYVATVKPLACIDIPEQFSIVKRFSRNIPNYC